MNAAIFSDSVWLDVIVVMLVLWVADRWRRSNQLERAARAIAAQTETTYNSGYRWEETDITKFQMLDGSFYEKAAAEMAELGFIHALDMNCLHITEANANHKVFIRTFLTERGDCYGSAFHFRVCGWDRVLMRLLGHKPDHRIIGFASGLSDGRFIHTANNHGLPKMSHPDEVVMHRHPINTPAHVLLAHHRETLAQLCGGGDTDPVPLKASTLDQVLELEKREHMIEQAYRQGIECGFTEDEVRDLSPNIADGERKRFLELMKKQKK